MITQRINAYSDSNMQPLKRIRPDYGTTLQRSLQTLMGPAGTQQRAAMEKALGALLDGETGKVDLDRLPQEAKDQLLKLQTAAEGFEAVFVKGLLGQMRRTSFSEESSAMGDFAKDTLDQALADQTSKSASSLGIGQTIFNSTAPRIVREAAAKLAAYQLNQGKA